MSTNDGISSDDLNRRANEEWHKNQEKPSKDYSQAKYSNITTPTEDTRKKNIAEGIISDLANQRNEIDSIKEMLKVLLDQQNQLATMVNKITETINQSVQSSNAANSQIPSEKGLNLESLTAIGDVAEKVIGVWKTYKGGDGPAPLISQEIVNKEMTEAFFDNLNTGKSINNFVKDALKKKATKQIVNSTMEALGHDEHPPQ